MEEDIRAYFGSWEDVACDKRLLRYTATQLCRAGISDRPSLCHMLETDPGALFRLRNIGSKSLAIIRRVCTDFKEEIQLHMKKPKEEIR